MQGGGYAPVPSLRDHVRYVTRAGGHCTDDYQDISGGSPRESLSLPRLRLVQNRIRREHAYSGHAPQLRLPLTLPLLQRIRPHVGGETYEESLWWAAACLCVFQGRQDHCTQCIIL